MTCSLGEASDPPFSLLKISFERKHVGHLLVEIDQRNALDIGIAQDFRGQQGHRHHPALSHAAQTESRRGRDARELHDIGTHLVN